MNKVIPFDLRSIGLPVFLIGLIAWLAKSDLMGRNPEVMSMAITVDLVLTVPLVYLMLIRNTSVQKLSAFPIFLLGLATASVVLPSDYQGLLNLIRTWILPVIELTVVLVVARQVNVAIKTFRQQGTDSDVTTSIHAVCDRMLPGRIAAVIASELAVMYYGFVCWRRVVPRNNQFTYHKKSGTVAWLTALLFVVVAETMLFHLLLSIWDTRIAWTMTAFGLYAVLQLFSLLKSVTRRPIVLTQHRLMLCYGIVREAWVDLDNIDTINVIHGTVELDKNMRSLSLLGKIEGHNVLITMKETAVLKGFYGMNRTFKSLALHMDNPEAFKSQVEAQLKSIGTTP